MKYTVQDILEIIEEEEIEFLYLQFTDILGVMKNIAITGDEIERALKGELTFDGSSIDGFVRVEEYDMYLKPDLDTFLIYPWRGSFGREARVICNIYSDLNTPFNGDPRFILQRVIDEASALGYSFNFGPECEFFLFHTDSNGKATLNTHDDAGYFDLAPVDLGENARRDMVVTLRKMGFEVDTSHHEVAPGQHEIDLKSDIALHAADKIVTFKTIVRKVAKNHGLHATFMPKPMFKEAGSGMHMNVSMHCDGKDAFKGDLKGGLSKEAMYFIGGVLKHAKAICALTNPTVNSYKRLLSGYEAPRDIAWSFKNRGPLIRVPALVNSKDVRIEIRNPDPSCNPYLAFAVILKAGLEGIKNKIDPGSPIEEVTEDIDRLPSSLESAITCLIKDDVIKDALKEHIFKTFTEAKKIEFEDYRSRITSWEIDQYLTKF
ncbi:type I glutamate--ammonia ligase [Clostridium cylindrosporum]|uniref:Glutamine synthetase n=1 Tax=Clostridium cylindrosporum DSM 605 TaxID=1121307 RepID=A0A0J8D787_CLOCY|nr:type I glutamate--ammonia ligase [Clostridium cylindrosporum]KMT21762.1 glutamine synthetase GlnA [Clostridium cylindrosporum DSM 605]